MIAKPIPSPALVAMYRQFVEGCIASGPLKLPEGVTIDDFVQQTEWSSVK